MKILIILIRAILMHVFQVLEPEDVSHEFDMAFKHFSKSVKRLRQVPNRSLIWMIYSS